jgi:polygalacturonase
VHISDCHISVGDDCIVIKSGRDEDGREAGKPSENIAISNCTMLKGHGGVVIGSETSGDVRRVAISNCVFEGTDVGIRIKTMRGRGGIVEDIRVSNVLMYDMVQEGVIITMRYQPTDPEPFSERTPVVRNVHFSGISIMNADRAIAVYGLPEKEISGLTFNDMRLVAKKGILLENAADMDFSNIKMEITEKSPFIAKDSKDILYDRVTLSNPAGEPVINLSNCSTVIVSNCYQPGRFIQFLNQDDQTSGLCFINNVMQGTQKLYNKGTIRATLISNIYNNLK